MELLKKKLNTDVIKILTFYDKLGLEDKILYDDASNFLAKLIAKAGIDASDETVREGILAEVEEKYKGAVDLFKRALE